MIKAFSNFTFRNHKNASANIMKLVLRSPLFRLIFPISAAALFAISCASYPIRQTYQEDKHIISERISKMEILIEDKMDNIPSPTFEMNDLVKMYDLPSPLSSSSIENKLSLIFHKCIYGPQDVQDSLGKKFLSLFTLTLYPVDIHYICKAEAIIISGDHREKFYEEFEEIDRWGILSLFSSGYGAGPALSSNMFIEAKKTLVRKLLQKSEILTETTSRWQREEKT